MTALMGASGAGKTTLMTALSQRGAAGVVTGDMLVDGKPLGPGFQKSTGLVLQADVHLATQTVREAVEFSALLRQPANVPHEEKIKDAQRVIELLELEDLADALIGHPGAGLGIERRKRVTIAVELAAKPDLLLFLDEPTSGLDSAGAASICRLLRRLAQDGQAILCTIHQPSALLFESFDNVLLLQPGGRTSYFGQIGEHHGKGSDRIREYFEANGAEPCDPQANVAEYILEVVSGGKSHGKDWGAKWLESKECQNTRDEIKSIVEERSQLPASDDPRAKREFAAAPMVQLKQVTLRQYRDMWRDPSFPYAILFSNFVTGIIAGGAFAKLGLSPTDYQNRVFIAFLIILNFPAIVNGIIAKFFELRMLFEVRENASKIYPWWAMMASFILTTMPIAFVASIIYFLPSYFLPFYAEPSAKAGYFYLMVLLFNAFGIEFSLMLAASSPTPITAANLLPFILPILAIVNGVIVPHSMMPNPWRDFVYWVNPVTHYLRGQMSTILHATPVVCNEEDLFRFDPPPGQTCDAYAGAWATGAGGYLVNGAGTSGCGFCQYTIGDQFAETVNAPYDFRWQSMGIFLGFVIFNVWASFALYWLFRVRGFGLSFAPVKKMFKRK
jgi:ABC-type multidrug transport system ATPase subunit